MFFLPPDEPLAAWDSAVLFLPLLAWDSAVFFLPPDEPLAAWDSRVFKLATVAAWIPSAARFCNRFISVARNCACRRRIVGLGTSLCSLMNWPPRSQCPCPSIVATRAPSDLTWCEREGNSVKSTPILQVQLPRARKTIRWEKTK